MLIIGGGIAGPVAAMALRKAGISSTVYEAYPTGADDVGAFLTLPAASWSSSATRANSWARCGVPRTRGR